METSHLVLIFSLIIFVVVNAATEQKDRTPITNQGAFLLYSQFYGPDPYYDPGFDPFAPAPRDNSEGQTNGLFLIALSILISRGAFSRRTQTVTTPTTVAPSLTTSDPFSDWVSHKGCRYKAFYDLVTHSDAKTECANKGTNADIAHTNMKTASDRLAIVTKAGVSEGATIWFGLEDTDGEGGGTNNSPLFKDGDTFTVVSEQYLGLATATTPACAFHSLSYTTYITFVTCTERRFYLCQVCP